MILIVTTMLKMIMMLTTTIAIATRTMSTCRCLLPVTTAEKTSPQATDDAPASRKE